MQKCHYDLFKAIGSVFTWIAAQPDPSAVSSADVEAVLRGQPDLQEASDIVTGSCLLEISDFSAMVPRIFSTLKQLARDLKPLKVLASERDPARLRPSSSFRPSKIATALTRETERASRRRELISMDSYEMPPEDFQVKPPSAMPQLLLPLVIHILLYKSGDGIGPEGYESARFHAERQVLLTNMISKPANVQYFIKVRASRTRSC